jgi:hypothetical protein
MGLTKCRCDLVRVRSCYLGNATLVRSTRGHCTYPHRERVEGFYGYLCIGRMTVHIDDMLQDLIRREGLCELSTAVTQIRLDNIQCNV